MLWSETTGPASDEHPTAQSNPRSLIDRMQAEIERRTRQHEAVAELGQAALTGIEVDVLLGQTCALLEELLGPGRYAILEESGGDWVLRAAVGKTLGFDHCSEHDGRHVAAYRQVLAATAPIVSTNLAQDPRLSAAHFVEAHGVSSAATVTIPGRRRPYGVLVVFTAESRTYSSDEVAFLRAVADLTGAAIESARAEQARRSAEKALRSKAAWFKALVEHSSDGIMLIDRNSRISYVGPSTQRVIGFDEYELVGRDVFEFVHEDDVDLARAHFDALLSGVRVEVRSEFRIRHGDGGHRWVEAFAKNLLDREWVGAMVVNYRDITERKETEDRLATLAYRDSLTGLPNRFLLYDRLSHAIDHARRSQHGLAVMYLDLDHFKIVNDTLGHAVGDQLLQQVAHRLQEAVRLDDTIARLGGDEFALLLPDLTHTEDAGVVAQKLLSTFTEAFRVEGHELYTTASIGVSFFPDDADDVTALLRNADSALYRAKDLGRNTVQLFAASMNDRYRQRLDLEVSLHHALEREEFQLYYQPVYDCKTASVRSFEALIRWKHPELGTISPDQFIAIAEEARLIGAIDRWVLRTACRQLRAWRDEGMPVFRVAVNISAHELQQPTFIHDVHEAISSSGLSADDLILEITESAAIQNLNWTLSVLDQLRALGVHIAIDDFGTGQSSLAYLKRFPIDIVKIDREFLSDATKTPSDAAILASIVALGHSLDLYVIAEGIEHQHEVKLLLSQGCDALQGFFFSVPVPADEVGALVRRVDLSGSNAAATAQLPVC